ncbi:MAG: hypothetical protein LBD85_06505, partial [Oscillospiraceae bacterium]|nr:hypothetical protein [Oscillospiraceae bacterium]
DRAAVASPLRRNTDGLSLETRVTIQFSVRVNLGEIPLDSLQVNPKSRTRIGISQFDSLSTSVRIYCNTP